MLRCSATDALLGTLPWRGATAQCPGRTAQTGQLWLDGSSDVAEVGSKWLLISLRTWIFEGQALFSLTFGQGASGTLWLESGNGNITFEAKTETRTDIVFTNVRERTCGSRGTGMSTKIKSSEDASVL